MKFYLVYKNNGLYDPVLDDQEPIYYEQGDLDPQSQPTEVPFKIQKFVEPEDLGSRVLNNGTNTEPLSTLYDPSILLLESRSLTASPLVVPTKPYRPFSTEPTSQIPPLEDPIILNPEYKDQFGKVLDNIDPDYIINECNKNGLKNKFKLPKSNQYDPDGARKIENIEIDSILKKYIKMENLSKQSIVTTETISNNICTEATVNSSTHKSISKDIKKTLTENLNTKEYYKSTVANSVNQEDSSKIDLSITKKEDFVLTENMEEELINIELNHIEKMKHDASIMKIEKTAMAIVENSIEQAISVTEEIKKEMEEDILTVPELRSVDAFIECDNKISERNEKQSVESSVSNITMQNRQLDSIEIQGKLSREEQVQNVRKSADNEIINDDRSNNICKSEVRTENKSKFVASDKYEISPSNSTAITQESLGVSQQLESKDEFKKEKITTSTKSKSSEAEKRTYAIGLQTIPNIRGVVHSSCHYDLLLKTFFIHLTDVMVALSRFVLTQPIFNTETNKMQENMSENERCERSMTCKRTVNEEKLESINRADMQTVAKNKINVDLNQKTTEEVTKKKIKPVIVQDKKDMHDQKIETDIIIEKKRELVTPVLNEIKSESQNKIQNMNMNQNRDEKIISGAQMAQRTERKLTKDVTKKMDAVISEFQNIAVEEDRKEWFQRNRRSRSRSQIEEEVAKESDPLEWLSKVDKQRVSEEIREKNSITNKCEYSTSETFESKQKIDIKKHEVKNKKFKSPKQTYVAVVEAHVYTNKNAIFEDVTEFSDTSSIQSAEEVNSAYEGIETVSTENVALENAEQQIEHAKVIEEWRDLHKVDVQSAIITHEINENIHESKSNLEKINKKQTELKFSDVQEVVSQESIKIIEPMVEIKEFNKKESITVDINKSSSVAESNEINILESKNEFSAIENKIENTVDIEEITDDYKTQVMNESEKIKNEKAITDIKSESQIEDVVESVILKCQKPAVTVGEEYAALKIIKEVETEVESVNEITEVEEVLDISKDIDAQTVINKMEMSQELTLDESKVITEKSIVSSKFGLAKSEISLQSASRSLSESLSSKFEQIQNNKTENYISNEIVQESSFKTQSVDKKLGLQIDLNKQKSTDSECSTIDTPTPSTLPPTPLTDEYIFKLTIPLPKSRGSTPIPRDCTLSPEDEDPHIVKKKLIPHIETTIEKVIYDPPLPTPPGDRILSPPIYKIPGLFGGGNTPKLKPVFRKPGLFGGADNPEYTKEEIKEIERKSSLLASAIDQTIKSIEEYKEEVGIEKKKEMKVTEFKKEISSETYEEHHKREIVLDTQTQQHCLKKDIKTVDEVIENGDKTINNNYVNTSSEKKDEILSFENSTNNIPEIVDIAIKNEMLSNVSQTKEEENEKETFQASEVGELVTEKETLKVAETLRIEVPKETSDPDYVEKSTDDKKEVVIDNKEKSNSTLVDTISQQPEVKENGEKEVELEVIVSNEISDSQIEVTDVLKKEEKKDPMLGFRPVVFEPEAIQKRSMQTMIMQNSHIEEGRQTPYMTESGEILGTIQGIVDGLEEPILDEEVAKELGKPGISEDTIAELISGEAEMLREAHVMGLSRVLTSHMHRVDDSSIDFQKIKPMIGSLKDSEVLKALNEELARQKEEQRKKEEKRWTTFLQKPKRPVPKAKFGYHGWTKAEQALVEEPYQVKIVKQAKPKVAPDYKPEDFETGPLPWEERAEVEASLPPVEAEEPILVPELPEFLEAVDPLTESEVPDLEDTGIPLPLPKDPSPPPEVEPIQEDIVVEEESEVHEIEELTQAREGVKEVKEDMENRLAEQLVRNVQSMVDPNASIEQQLCQMRAQLAALAQLPEVIQQSLEVVSSQLKKMTHQEATLQMSASHEESQSYHIMKESENKVMAQEETHVIENGVATQRHSTPKENGFNNMTIEVIEDNMETGEKQIVQQENRRVCQTPLITEEEQKTGQMKKAQLAKENLDAEARQIKQRATPRVGKPKRMFGPLDPDSRPVVLPGGRRWRKTEDVYNEQLIAETLQAQSELLQGKTMGINFMKYEKPPVTLDHLQHSETYKLVHDMDQPPLKRVEMLTPVIAEADYRERCRSMTPSSDKKHLQIPQQFHP